MASNAIIESITCPITLAPMINPVTAPDGQTYEKNAIIQWLNEKGTSPHDRREMNINQLQVNVAIRFLCDKYHNGEFTPLETSIAKPPIAKPPIFNNSINLNCDVYKRITTNDNHVMLTFEVDESNDYLQSFPKDERYLSQDVIIVIDRSGSMGTPATCQDSNGNNRESGWSVQDIVNHAACTIIKSVNSNTRIAIIAFDNFIEEIIPLTLMSEINKLNSIIKVKEIKPRGQTNIWGGIEKAISILDKRDDKTRNGNIMALTDGIPNISPARGEVETLKKLRINKNFTSSIYTFGFGYNLQEGLLYNLAKVANGGHGYISDGNMIATVMCNFISTILTTIVSNLQLHVTSKSQNRILPDFILGDYESNVSSCNYETIFDIGTVQIQQTRDIIMNLNPNELYEIYYTYKIGNQPYTSNTININTLNCNGIEIPKNISVDIHMIRYNVVNAIQNMINNNLVNNYNYSRNAQVQLENKIEEFSKQTNDVLIHGLLNNLKQIVGQQNSGQIKMAVTNCVYFNKWGKYYLDQVCRSLNNQQKPNFKDKGMPFGGPTFENLVDHVSNIFNSLPPPEPSLNMKTYYNNSSTPYNNISRQSINQPIVMASFNNANGGCFDSNCKITMADGSMKVLKNLNKGDKIQSCDLNNNPQIASIVCILEIKITCGIREFVDFENGLYITPWHPIKYKNKWVFPANIKEPIIKSCSSIITLLLDNHHIGFINGHQCIMLGHNYKNGILNHPFYGTNAIVNIMKNHYSWETGKIILNDSSISFIKEDEMTSNIKIDTCTTRININVS